MKKRYNSKIVFTLLFLCSFFMISDGAFGIIGGNGGYFSAAEAFVGAAIIIYTACIIRRRKRDMNEYVDMIVRQSGNLTSEVLTKFPLPMLILSVDGGIMWHNDTVSEIFKNNSLYGIQLSQLLPELKWTDILKMTNGIDVNVSYDGRKYNIIGCIVKNTTHDSQGGESDIYSVLIYFIDKTEIFEIQKKHENEKTDIAIVTIDNYDDIFQKVDDAKSQEIISRINACVSKWVAESNGVMKKTSSDRYMVFFEHKNLAGYTKAKFDILDKVRAIGEEMKLPITISIGIGTGGHISENEEYARNAVDMVWGRGGDQVAVKNELQYKFFGGKTTDYEKSTRVKTRIFSSALREMIIKADNVIFMGHKAADYDSLGAAIGLQRAVRSLGKRPYIIYDYSQATENIISELKAIPEYNDMLIGASSASDLITEDTLLIVLDTHRPSMLPLPQLLSMTNKIVLIDHHRKSTEFIENCSLTYHEPYASSTCEMVTEILQYINESKKLTAFEAKALYVGILMDTKNFVTKTGARTFEAASYLKRYGLNTMEVKKIFNIDKEEYIRQIDIVRNAEIFRERVAIASADSTFSNIRVIASRAADSLLNISGIAAGFVIYPLDDEMCVSARSLGTVNVQLIMEKIGGGGHMTVAGAQMKGKTRDEVFKMLTEAIEEYFTENPLG